MTSMAIQHTEDTVDRFATFFSNVTGGIFGLLYLILFIAAAISILRNQRLTGGGKFLWIIVAFTYPFLGSLGWFFFGRDARLVKQPQLAHPNPTAS